jgi:predicted CXXCH cytochrome family protein
MSWRVAWLVVLLVACRRDAPRTTNFECGACHLAEVSALASSMHAKGHAVASASTVPAGAVADFTIAHVDGGVRVSWPDPDGGLTHGAARFTLGVEPLVQVAVETPGGRLQVPPIGWRPDAGWLSLAAVSDWRGPAFSWNGACAACHSTGFHVGALDDGGFESRWSALSVTCAACHGDAAGHQRWVEAGRPAAEGAGFARSLRQRASFSFDDGGVIARASGVSADEQTLTCAACHARRRALVDDNVTTGHFFDRFEPELMRPGAFAADGRALDEVYEASPFLLSRMQRAGVRCSDCHEPHGGGLKASGDALCARCHLATTFADARHHAHPRGAVTCAGCHLPGIVVLGVDERHDHSLRRPGSAVCQRCHAQVPASALRLRDDDDMTLAFRAVSSERADAAWRLERLAAGGQASSFELASLLALRTGEWTPSDVALLTRAAAGDDWLRFGAASALVNAPAPVRHKVGDALLRDARRAVRVRAARALLADGLVPAAVAAEVEEAERVNAFRGEAWLTRSEVARARGDQAGAARLLEEGVRRQPDFVPLLVNLADLRRGEAEALLSRAAFDEGPWQASAAYALGLARWRAKDAAGALAALSVAARDGSPRHLVAWCLAEREVRGKPAGWAALDVALLRAPGAVPLLDLWERWARADGDAARVEAARADRSRWAPR